MVYIFSVSKVTVKKKSKADIQTGCTNNLFRKSPASGKAEIRIVRF
jgi:hypothetical protein